LFFIRLHIIQTLKQVQVRPDYYRDPLRVQSFLHRNEDFLFLPTFRPNLQF
jgi:hypothetical protein